MSSRRVAVDDADLVDIDDDLDADIEAVMARVDAFATLFDRAIRIPGTNIRFGLDSIIGLVPVAGDTLTAFIGLYPIIEAMRLGVGRRAVPRMLANLGIDWLVGLVPLLDIVLDVAFKANVRNARVLARVLREERA